MDKKQEILKKYRAFNEYLESINLDELRNKHTRQELNAFKEQLYGLKTRNLAYEISELTRKMKEEEYPELLGVHHFPILRQIDFMTENKKIELDQFLAGHRVGNYIYNLWHFTSDEKRRKQLEEWLIEHGVAEKQYSVLCPNCSQGWISSLMSGEEKEKLDIALKQYKEKEDWESYDIIMDKLEHSCIDCELYFDLTNDIINRLQYKSLLKMKMERDTSLDNL